MGNLSLEETDAVEEQHVLSEQLARAALAGVDRRWVAAEQAGNCWPGNAPPWIGTVAGFNSARIVASSGFTPFKCKMFGHARAPVDVIGTGSFIPEAFGDTFATADIFMYDGQFGIKYGREKLFQGLKP